MNTITSLFKEYLAGGLLKSLFSLLHERALQHCLPAGMFYNASKEVIY